MNVLKFLYDWLVCRLTIRRLRFKYRRSVLAAFSLGDYVTKSYVPFSHEDELKLVKCDRKGDFIADYITSGPIKKQFAEETQLELFNHPKAASLLIELAGNQYLYPSVQAKVFELGKWEADDVMRHYCVAGFDMTEETQVKVLDLPHAWHIFTAYITDTMKSWSCAAQLKLLDKPNALIMGGYLVWLKKGFCPAAMVELLRRHDLEELIYAALKEYTVDNEAVWKAILERDDAPDLVWYLVKNFGYYNNINPDFQADIIKLENRKKIFLQVMKKHKLLSYEVQTWLFENMQRDFLRYYLNAQYSLANKVIKGIFALPDSEKIILRYIKQGGCFSDKIAKQLLERFEPNIANYMVLCYASSGADISDEMQVYFIRHISEPRAFIQRYTRHSSLCPAAKEIAKVNGWL